MAYLRLYRGETLQKQWKIESDLISIGRAKSNTIVLPSRGVSKYHATIARDGEYLVLEDRHSANGVYVNGKRIQSCKLNYWDEIQIFEYVIKYMASARLPGEQEGLNIDMDTEIREDSTREILIANHEELAKLRQDNRTPHLSAVNGRKNGTLYPVEGVSFSIGRSRACDMRLGGWFKPKVMARIQRRTNGFYLSRIARGRLAVNGKKIRNEIQLQDDDLITIHGLQYKFFHRPIDNTEELS